MKRPKTQTLRRPRMASARIAQTPKEAAIDLVRLEFDAERLRMGVEQAVNRANSYQIELDRNQAQRAILLNLLNP
jgi:hypothetical protein